MSDDSHIKPAPLPLPRVFPPSLQRREEPEPAWAEHHQQRRAQPNVFPRDLKPGELRIDRGHAAFHIHQRFGVVLIVWIH